MLQLSEALLAILTAELDGDDVTGLVLGGSYARGDAGPYSDVDLAPIIREGRPVPPKRFFYRDGLLGSVSPRTLARWRAAMYAPETAIYALPSIREVRILLDKDGSIADLKREARGLTWDALQPEANRAAARAVFLAVEDAMKTFAALEAHDASALCRALLELLYAMPLAVALHRGVLVASGNTFFNQLYAAAGADSAWTIALREALGAVPPHESSLYRTPLEARGVAALRLYAATAAMLRPALTADEIAVIDTTLDIIRAAGYPVEAR